MRLLQPDRRAARRASSTQIESGEGLGLLVDRRKVWAKPARTLARGNIPGWTAQSLVSALFQSRYLSDEGRLFFNSPDELVPAGEQPQRERLRVRARGRRQLRKPLRRLCRAGLLRQLGQGIGLPRSDAERQRRLLPHRRTAAAPGHRHRVRHLRRARLHEPLAVPDDPTAGAAKAAAKQKRAARPSHRYRAPPGPVEAPPSRSRQPELGAWRHRAGGVHENGHQTETETADAGPEARKSTQGLQEARTRRRSAKRAKRTRGSFTAARRARRSTRARPNGPTHTRVRGRVDEPGARDVVRATIRRRPRSAPRGPRCRARVRCCGPRACARPGAVVAGRL